MNELPKIFCPREAGVLLVEREVRTKEKVPNRILVQDPVNEQALCMLLEVNAVVHGPVAMEHSPIPAHRPKLLSLERLEISGKKMKLRQQLQLKVLRKRCHLGRTYLVKNHLEHAQTIPAGPLALASREFSFVLQTEGTDLARSPKRRHKKGAAIYGDP